MYIDESGGSEHEIKVTVEGEEYTAETNFDSHTGHHDGNDDTAVVQTDHGYIAFTDSQHTGTADVMRTLDEQGNVVSEAKFDSHTGQWVSVDPHTTNQDTAGKHQDHMVVDTPEGPKDVGPPTEDTGSGHPDTAVVKDAQGNTWLYTDTDGDGQADVAVEITTAGEVTISQHTGEHQWTQVEHGHLDTNGKYVPDTSSVTSASDEFWALAANDQPDHGQPDQPTPTTGRGTWTNAVIRIDSATGQWVNTH